MDTWLRSSPDRAVRPPVLAGNKAMDLYPIQGEQKCCWQGAASHFWLASPFYISPVSVVWPGEVGGRGRGGWGGGGRAN